MTDKKENYSDVQAQTGSRERKLRLLFRGLFALVPSTRLASDGNPSSVTLLFPIAFEPGDMQAELGAGHTHYIDVPSATYFDQHNLYLHVGTISGNTFTINDSIQLNPNSEIVFYDGAMATANEINSPSLNPMDPTRNDPANSVKMDIQDDRPVGSPNVINLHNIYQNENNSSDRKLEARNSYMGTNAMGLAGRVFRLRKGALQGFYGVIYGPSAPDMSTQHVQNCLSDPEICYSFNKHNGSDYPGNVDLVRKSVTDTLIFEKTLTNDRVTVSVNGTELQSFPVDGNEVCLLLQHIGPYREVNLPMYDIDFALTYRASNVGAVASGSSNKQRRIPKIDRCSGGGGKIRLDAVKPVICAMAMFSSDDNA